MKSASYIFILMSILTSCVNQPNSNQTDLTLESPPKDSVDSLFIGEPEDYKVVELDDSLVEAFNMNFSTFYVVVVDSSLNYYGLNKKMYQLSEDLSIKVDTMSRSYNSKKDLIVLPLDADDQMYAGDYYPRRYASDWLSLEYLYVYDENLGDKTIGLIAGVFNDKKSADSLNNIVIQREPQSFVLKGYVYVGCMH